MKHRLKNIAGKNNVKKREIKQPGFSMVIITAFLESFINEGPGCFIQMTGVFVRRVRLNFSVFT
jgi:hypothetical protein